MTGERGEGLGWRIEMSPSSPEQPHYGYTIPSLTDSHVSYFKLTHSYTGLLNGCSLLLHMTSPCLSFIWLLAVYGYTERPLCICHTQFRKVKQAQRRGEGVSALDSVYEKFSCSIKVLLQRSNMVFLLWISAILNVMLNQRYTICISI